MFFFHHAVFHNRNHRWQFPIKFYFKVFPLKKLQRIFINKWNQFICFLLLNQLVAKKRCFISKWTTLSLETWKILSFIEEKKMAQKWSAIEMVFFYLKFKYNKNCSLNFTAKNVTHFAHFYLHEFTQNTKMISSVLIKNNEQYYRGNDGRNCCRNVWKNHETDEEEKNHTLLENIKKNS